MSKKTVRVVDGRTGRETEVEIPDGQEGMVVTAFLMAAGIPLPDHKQAIYHDYSAIRADLPALLEIALSALHHDDTCEFLALSNSTTAGLSVDELRLLRDRLISHLSKPDPIGTRGSPLAHALAAVPGYDPDWKSPGEDVWVAPDQRTHRAGFVAGRRASHLASTLGDIDDAYLAAQRAVYQPG